MIKNRFTFESKVTNMVISELVMSSSEALVEAKYLGVCGMLGEGEIFFIRFE
jgi:hypothetical protein